MSDEEIRELAVDIAEGRVFGTWNLLPGEVDLVTMIFMPVLFMEKIPEDTYHVYEYIAKAMPRGINGYPMFMSCRFMNKEFAEKLFPMVKRLIEEREKFIAGKE